MAAKSNGASRFSAEELAEVLDLIKGSDSVELKLTIPVSAHRSTIRGLPIDPVEAEPRQAFFFDTPDLDLNKAGIVVRARRIQGGDADTVVKLRPVIPDDLPDSLRRSPAFKVEVDALPGGYVCSGSLKGRSSNDEVAAAVAGEIPLAKVLTKDQRAFFAKHAPRGVTLDKLVPLGPSFLLKTRFLWKRLDRNITAELWLYPDGSRILELSTKAAPNEAFQVAMEFRAYMAKHGIQIDSFGSVQQTKTKTALAFFSAEHKRSRQRAGKNGAKKKASAKAASKGQKAAAASA